MDTATHADSSPEISLNAEILESSFKRTARRAPEFVDAVFPELFQLYPGSKQTVRGHDHLE
jgi:hypothetical protein